MKISYYKGFEEVQDGISAYSRTMNAYTFGAKETGVTSSEGKKEIGYYVAVFAQQATESDVKTDFIRSFMELKGFPIERQIQIMTRQGKELDEMNAVMAEAESYVSQMGGEGAGDTEAALFEREVQKKVQTMFFQKSVQSEINTFDLTPKEALAVKDLYPEWKAGIPVKKGERYQCDNLLWEVVQPHATQDNWKPSLATASLWKVVDEEHEGGADDPIPYNPPMEIFKGKIYIQNGVKYRCTRDSGQPLTHDLSALVGLYVEQIN